MGKDRDQTLEKLKNIKEENIEKLLAKVVEVMDIEENYAFTMIPSASKTEIVIYPLLLGERKINMELGLIDLDIGIVKCSYSGVVSKNDLLEFNGVERKKHKKVGA